MHSLRVSSILRVRNAKDPLQAPEHHLLKHDDLHFGGGGALLVSASCSSWRLLPPCSQLRFEPLAHLCIHLSEQLAPEIGDVLSPHLVIDSVDEGDFLEDK